MVRYSICIVTYNRLNDLQVALKSILSQIDNTCEIIIVDNSSNSDTNKFVNTLNDTRIKYFKNSVNSVAKARNLSFKKSKGKYVVVFDDDCVAHSTWFSAIKECCDKADVVMGRVIIPKSTLLGDSISALGYPAGANLGFEKMWKVDDSGFTSHISFCNCIIRKDILEKSGYLDESFKYMGEDTEFSKRLIDNGFRIRYIPQVTIYHKPRKELRSFVKWHLARGRSNYYLKKRLGNLGPYFTLRLWSAKNIFLTYVFDPKIVLIVPLLFLSYTLQVAGYWIESWEAKK